MLHVPQCVRQILTVVSRFLGISSQKVTKEEKETESQTGDAGKFLTASVSMFAMLSRH